MMVLRTVALAALAALALPSIVRAADPTFTGPSGWSHVPPAVTDPSRTMDQWKLGGDATDAGQTVTFINDKSGSYADTLAAIKKNFSDNHIKTSADADMPCQGKQGHVVEFTIGPTGREVIINRLLVPEANGLVTITYSRGKDYSFDDDVKKAIDKFCAATPN